MSKLSANQNNITGENAEKLALFYDERGILAQACREIGIDYQVARKEIQKPAGERKVYMAIVLTEWMRLWEKHENERRELREYVRENQQVKSISE